MGSVPYDLWNINGECIKNGGSEPPLYDAIKLYYLSPVIFKAFLRIFTAAIILAIKVIFL